MKKIKPVKVVQHGDRYRVAEANGDWAGTQKLPVDGGGFADEKAAKHLAAQINERRVRKGLLDGRVRA